MTDPRPLVQTMSGIAENLVPAGPIRTQLTTARDELVAAMGDVIALPQPPVAGPALNAAITAYNAAAGDWATALQAVAGADLAGLLKPMLDMLPIPGLRELLGSVGANGIDEQVNLGPLLLRVQVPPVDAAFPAIVAGAPPPVFLGYASLGSVGLDLDLAPMGGGGYLAAQGDRLSGVLELKLGIVDVHAFGIIEHVSGDLSVLVLLGARFFPGIQLSFGFAIGAIGGLVGINRTIDVDAARRKLSDGSVTDALFPDDPVAKAPSILASLGELFPPRDGSAVFGPTFELTWGQLSPTGPAIAQADLGLLIELPGPRRIVLVGRLVIALPPGPINLVHLELDVLGVIDFVAALVSIDASLVNSSVLGVLRITGDAAFRLSWGDRPYMLLSIGGFFPGFTPEPSIGRALARLAITLDSPVPGVTIRAEGYFAVTTNTLQFGGRLEAGISAGPVEAAGFVALDAIATFRPFHFEVDYSAGFAVRFDGVDLASITVSGTISGPGPLSISASLEVDILFLSVSWGETFTIGDSVDQGPPPVSLHDIIKEQLDRPANLRGVDVTDPAVKMAPRSGLADAPQVALVAPTGTLQWSQSVLPFDTTIMELRGAPASDAGQLSFDAPSGTLNQTGASDEWFSPASFRHLTAAESLNQPSFAELPGGSVLALVPAMGPVVAKSSDFEVYVRREDDKSLTALGSHALLAFGSLLASRLAGRAGAPTLTNDDAVLTIDRAKEKAWSVAGGGTAQSVSSETEAHTQVALSSPAQPLAAARVDDRVALGGVL